VGISNSLGAGDGSHRQGVRTVRGSDVHPIRAVIVGPGTIGRIHALAMAELDDYEVVGLVDGAHAQQVAGELVERGAPRPHIYEDLDDALDDPAIDLVVVATPSGLHAEQALEALAHEKHVLVEKPLDIDLSRARRLENGAKLAAHRGILCSLVSQHRFNEANALVHDAIGSGRFGMVSLAVASVPWWRSASYYSDRPWRASWALDGGGALMNQGAHTVDLLLWFLGMPVEVSAKTAAKGSSEVEDTAVATIVFESGALATLSVTVAAYPGNVTRMEICGTQGSAVIEGNQLRYFHAEDQAPGAIGPMGLNGRGNQASQVTPSVVAGHILVDDPTTATGAHKDQYRALASALHAGGPAPVDATAGLLSLATTLAVYASSALGEPVKVRDVLEGRHDRLLSRIREDSQAGAGGIRDVL
jgi:UDP-N-acetyl-2-amino-2-deoxyglucuronate dehydrogenase